MDHDSGQTVRRLTEEYGSWFLHDDRLAQGRLSGRVDEIVPCMGVLPALSIERRQLALGLATLEESIAAVAGGGGPGAPAGAA